MIIDQDTALFDAKDMTGVGTSGTLSSVVNTGTGDAYNPLWIYAAGSGLSGNLTLEVQTAADEAFGTPTVLGTYSLPSADGSAVKAKVPLGNLGYLRVKASASAALTAGTLNAFLVHDVRVS